MQVSRRRGRKTHPVFVGFLGILLVTGLSFCGALIWQNAQQTPAEPEKVGLGRSDIPVESENDGGEQAPDDAESRDAGESRGETAPEETAPEEDEPPRPVTGGDAEPVTQYTVEWQLSSSGAVDKSYFDDAIFFGDSVSTGITAYQIMDNAACIAAIGVSPHTAVDSQCIVTPNGKKTMLEAAKEKGERNKVYIMLGGNGLWMEKDAFIEGYQDFIGAVREQYPSAVIYIQSMTPVAVHVGSEYPTVSREKVVEYNAAIAQLAKDNGLPFVNVFEGLADSDGYLPADVSGDGLHLNAEYYYKWFDYLRAHTVTR